MIFYSIIKAQKHRPYICKETAGLQIQSRKFKFPRVLFSANFENILNFMFKRVANKYKVNIMFLFAAFFTTFCSSRNTCDSLQSFLAGK